MTKILLQGATDLPAWNLPEWWQPEWTTYAFWVALLVGFLCGIWLTLILARRYRRFLGGRRARLGRRAEKKALRVLRKNGYRLLERQPQFEHSLLVAGQLKQFIVTPDFTVRKGGRIFAVEVKSSRAGPLVSQAGVRRQILEYLLATKLPCLLVRMPEGQITTICLDEGLRGNS